MRSRDRNHKVCRRHYLSIAIKRNPLRGIIRRSFLLIVLTFHLSPFTSHLSPPTLQAQPTVVRHQCWDIDYTVPQGVPSVRVPMMMASVDSGALLVKKAHEYLGTPYRFGGRTPKAFDCAGFALYLYRQFGHSLPGWSGAQARLGVEVSDTRNLQPGDLVFFGGRHQTKTVGHTGIVVDADERTGVFRFIHASTGAGVIVSRSTEPYYKQRYITARRIFL